MRIEALVNGEHLCTAGLSVSGYLSAHLNVSERPDATTSRRVLRVVGIETNETESVHIEWPVATLVQGDSVTLRLLPDGETTAPISRQASSEAASNLLCSVTLAQEVLAACERFETELFAILAKVRSDEPAAEHQKFQRSVGHVAADLGERLLYPIYRNHPLLVPEQLRGEPK